ncbi:MAG: transposase [Thermodesulfobacteriota bacterium]
MYRLKDSTNEAKKFIKIIKSKVYPLIDFKQRHNTIYKHEKILDVLTYVAMNKDFTTNGTKTYSLLTGDSPHQNTIWYNLKKLGIKDVMTQFENIFETTYKMAKKQRVFEKPVDVAIDITDQLYYGDEKNPMVVRIKAQRGTSYAFRFATINIVERGRRFTLLALPMSELTTKEKVVKKLIDYAKSKIKIRTVYLDRGFFNCKIINLLNEMDVEFLMPAIKNSRIKNLMKEHSDPKIIDYQMGITRGGHKGKKLFRSDASHFNLVIVDDGEGSKRVFATNLDIEEKNAFNLFIMYRKRWGIETSYRVKGDFRVKTTSKNYVVRLFYFLFSVCLYNLWVLVNLFIGLSSGYSEKPTISAKIFGVIFYTTKKPGGFG